MASPPPEISMIGSSQQPLYYPEAPNDVTGGLPINLDSLRDGPPGSKPFYPYSTLIRYAIKGSPNQKLLLEDIYYAIESRFPYYRSAPPGWKNSVRHNLSLNPCFEKVPRPLTDRGKGSYWTVNDSIDPRTGVHRVRKKRAKTSSSQEPHQHQQPDQAHSDQPMPMTFDAPVDLPFPLFGPNDGQISEDVMQATLSKRRGGEPEYQDVQNGHYPMEGDPSLGYVENQLRPELDEHGNPDWRSIWHNELTKLKAFTVEQDKAGADPEWYRMMVARVRGGLVAIGPDGMPVPPSPPHHEHPIDHGISEDGDDDDQKVDLEQEQQQ
ncbi:hypothetical protein JB92DRAFT_3014366 [Gautieria morchelliformis]|nr:hypothetical protein JB92DRAFT_3014366 [Gautieria morchelliformis]